MKRRAAGKRIALVLVLFTACALFFPGVARAGTLIPEVRFRVGETACAVGYRGGPVMLVKMDVAPYLKSGRVLIPVRFLARAVGVGDEGILWDEKSQAVTLKKSQTVLSFTAGSPVMEKRTGSAAPELLLMDVPPEITNGRFCLPARWAAESFGCRVQWEPSEMAVSVLCRSSGDSE